MSSPAPSPQNKQLSDLKEQLEAQRSKRLAAVNRLKAATAEAAEGTPADSKVFRLFNHASSGGNGFASPAESEAVAALAAEESEAPADPMSKAPCRADLIEARRVRKARLVALKKTTFEVVTYQETRRFDKNKL